MALTKYGTPSLWDYVRFSTVLAVRIPVALCWTFTTSLHTLFLNPSKFKRTLLGNVLRQFLTGTPISVNQAISPSSVNSYLSWTKRHGLEGTVENLIDDTVLVWIGPKSCDKVILFAHGGGYIFPLQNYCLNFLRHVQLGLKDAGHNVGVAVLTYTLVPTAGMETHLTQITRAIEHILASGVHPKDLHLAGDSAGAQLCLAYFSHMLHPVNNVHKMKSSPRIGSLFLMSPWSSFSTDSPSMKLNAHSDLFPVSALQHYSEQISACFTSQPPRNPFTSPIHAPEGWFQGLDGLVDRVLVNAGSKELFCDDIRGLVGVLKEEKPDLIFVVEDGGVHTDSYVDFMMNTGLTSSLTPLVVNWYAEGLRQS